MDNLLLTPACHLPMRLKGHEAPKSAPSPRQSPHPNTNLAIQTLP